MSGGNGGDHKKPFDVCSECGSPLLEGEPKAVVLYFDSEAEKDDFVKMMNDGGHFRAYSVQ